MSIQTKSYLDSTQPELIYYDLQCVNNDTENDNPPIPLRFLEVRNNPFLMCPSNYFMSVVRFQIQTGDALPVFIPQVELGQPDVNKTIYTITLQYKTYIYQQNIMFYPDDLTQPQPNPPLTIQDITSEYYFVSSYQNWVEMINTAFKSAYDGLNVLVVAGGDVLPTANCPFMEFDPQGLIATIDADILGYDIKNLANPIKIFFNSSLYNLYSSFPAILQSYDATNGRTFLLNLFNNNNNNTYTYPTYTAIQLYQEGSTVAMLNPVSSIVFTTALLPVLPSNTSESKVFGTYSNLFNNGNNSNISPIITDIVVPIDATNRYRPNIVYNNSGEYRFFNLLGESPVNSVELSVFWKDNFGGLHSLLLNNQCSASIKIMFRRKDFNNLSIWK